MTLKFDQKKLENCDLPNQLGSHWHGHGATFALASKHAHQVELCIFDQSGQYQIANYELPLSDEGIFYGYLPEIQPGDCYGYRVYGPYEPKQGLRFNPNQLLIDPYSKQLKGQVIHHPSLYDYQITDELMNTQRFDPHILDHLKPSTLDSAAFVPKSMVVHQEQHPFQYPSPKIPWSKTIIYEAHVKGLTAGRQQQHLPYAGTYKALQNPKFINHLLHLGVNAIELLPIQTFLHDERLIKQGLRNYWGYQPIQFFSPMNDYFYTQQCHELKVSIDQLHKHGIEVILDVVYNHTGEGDHLGPTLSLRGIDQKLYYENHPDQDGFLRDVSGCGNRLNLSEPLVLRLVMDSLRYWVTAFKVDGFRFDLCSALGRDHIDFDQRAGFFQAIAQDPILSQVKLIAEPWDLGENGYRLGDFPMHWHEWNDQFRDRCRRFWRGDLWQKSELAHAICGTSALFKKDHKKPSASINYLCSHDGFCLEDLVSYEHKHNEANLENNQDGHHENYSCHYGVEGVDTDDHWVKAQRLKHKKNLWITLCLSRGTIMLLGGDEISRTQLGNNNAYCQDNEISYLNWMKFEGDHDIQQWYQFCAMMIHWRKNHPLLNANTWLQGKAINQHGLKDLTWLNRYGQELQHEDWHQNEDQELIFRLCNESLALLIALNPSKIDKSLYIDHTLISWRLILDSNRPDLAHPLIREDDLAQTQQELRLHGQSILILEGVFKH
jgi:isoamylase